MKGARPSGETELTAADMNGSTDPLRVTKSGSVKQNQYQRRSSNVVQSSYSVKMDESIRNANAIDERYKQKME